MKKLLFCVFLAGITDASIAQTCTLQINADTIVCAGSTVNVKATQLIQDQFAYFNNNQLPAGWQVSGSTNFSNNICGSSPDGTSYFWASTSTGTPQIQTADFNVCSGGTLRFELRYALQGDISPCEGPDETDEGISIEYSTDGGNSWIEFIYYQPDGQILAANPGGNISVAFGPTPFTVWTTQSVPIPAAAITNSTRFRWIQTQSSGGCCDNWGIDNIAILAGPCIQTNLQWSNGLSGTDNFSFTATKDTCFIVDLTNGGGTILCSDTICINVSQPHSDTSVSICTGENLLFGPAGAQQTFSTSGNYPVTFPVTNGCDSVVTLHLIVQDKIRDTVSIAICPNALPYTWNGRTQVTSGLAVDSVVNTSIVTNCDSITVLNLVLNNTYDDTFIVALCADALPYTLGAQSLTASGTYSELFTTVNTCDSLVTIHLMVNNAYDDTFKVVVCADELPYTLGSQSLTADGTYSELFTSQSTCDSFVTVQLKINNIYDDTIHIDRCINELPYILGSQSLTISGTFTEPFTSISGCDSSVTVILNVLSLLFKEVHDSVCSGTLPFLWNGINIQQGGDSVASYVTASAITGCDSTTWLSVYIIDTPQSSTVNVSGCGSVLFEGEEYTTATELIDTFTNVAGCDSLYRTVNVMPYSSMLTEIHIDSTGCNFVNFEQYQYYKDTIFIDTLRSINGCDSVQRTVAISVNSFALSLHMTPEQPFEGEEIKFETSGIPALYTTINWEPSYLFPDKQSLVQTVKTFSDDRVVVTAISADGCVDTASISYELLPIRKEEIVLPNIFTPNGDGINDFFRPGYLLRYYRIAHLRIVNRWGQIVYESFDNKAAWDGRYTNGIPAEIGVYYYIIEGAYNDGREKLIKGEILLAR